MPNDVMWIGEQAALERVVERVAVEPRMALDTEGNSMHAYEDTMCLVQVSVPSFTAIVDPLALDMTPLVALLERVELEKVMHGADYDILGFKRTHRCVFANLFDTAIAARVLGWTQSGLAALLQTHLGVTLDKRYQTYDWATRPLDPAALNYASEDTAHLLALQTLVRGELVASGKMELFEHACARQCRVEPRVLGFDALGFWKLKDIHTLGDEQRAALAALWRLRDAFARERNRPPFFMMGEGDMVRVARELPRDRAALRRVGGRGSLVRSAAARVLDALASASDHPAPPMPAKTRASKEERTRFDALRMWRKNEAARWEAEPDVVLPKAVLERLAQDPPPTEQALIEQAGLDAWEAEQFAAGLWQALCSA